LFALSGFHRQYRRWEVVLKPAPTLSLEATTRAVRSCTSEESETVAGSFVHSTNAMSRARILLRQLLTKKWKYLETHYPHVAAELGLAPRAPAQAPHEAFVPAQLRQFPVAGWPSSSQVAGASVSAAVDPAPGLENALARARLWTKTLRTRTDVIAQPSSQYAI